KEPFLGIEPTVLKNKIVISAVKGLLPSEHIPLTDWLIRDFQVAEAKVAVIGGPCHAEEVAQGRQSYLTIASPDFKTAEKVAGILNCRYVSASASTDLYGVEYAAVMKNIIALACGITHGLGYGDNFQAVLVSQAMREMGRFLDAIDPRPRELTASAYLGDLLVTAYSQFSRNRLFGNMIGRGYSVQAAQLQMNMIAEGYYAARSICLMNEQYQVEMPVTETVYQILYEGVSPDAAFKKLLEILK